MRRDHNGQINKRAKQKFEILPATRMMDEGSATRFAMCFSLMNKMSLTANNKVTIMLYRGKEEIHSEIFFSSYNVWKYVRYSALISR